MSEIDTIYEALEMNRYDIVGEYSSTIEQVEDGDYVLYSDLRAHDDAIRREVLQKVRAGIMDDHSEITYDNYEEGYKNGLENAIVYIDDAILGTESEREGLK